MLKQKLGLLGLCVTILTSQLCVAENNTAASKAVTDAYYAWCDAIGKAKGDSAVVVKFYAKDAILLPTLSSDVLVNHNGGLDAYFKKLTSLPEITCHTKKLINRMYKDTAINTGLYDFTYIKNGKMVDIPARFTFVYQEENDGKWMIIKHHSSKMPK